MTAALDIVEDALASLQARVLQAQQQQQQKQQKPELKNAETNTSLRVNTSIRTSSNSVLSEPRQKQKETSVLINRRPNALAIISKSHQGHLRGDKMGRAKKKPKPTIAYQESKHARESQQQPCISVPSSHDIPQAYSRFQENISFGSFRDYRENPCDSIHYNSDIRALHNQQRANTSKPAGSKFSKKKVSRNRERLSESSSDDSSQRRKHKLRLKPPQSSRQSHKSSQKRVSPRCKTTIPVADQRYAQSTLTSRLRGELSGPPKKEEKENLIPFIPCGSKSTSHHRALIIQQELSHLKNMTSKEQQLVTVPRSCLQEFDADESGSDSERVTEQTVKRALANIQQHITRKANMYPRTNL